MLEYKSVCVTLSAKDYETLCKFVADKAEAEQRKVKFADVLREGLVAIGCPVEHKVKG